MKNLQAINKHLRLARECIEAGKLEEALKHAKILEKYKKQTIIRINCGGIYIDVGARLKEEQLVMKGINLIQDIIPNIKNDKHNSSES